MAKQHFKLWKTTLLLLLGLFVFLYLFLNTVAESYVASTNALAGLHFHFEDETNRVVVFGVVPDSPAQRAGLQTGDEIIAIDNRPISTLGDFLRGVMHLDVGKLVEIKAVRNNAEVALAFTSQKWMNSRLIFGSLMPALFFGYSLCLIGTFVLLKKIRDRESRVFYLMCIFWALAMGQAFPQGFLLHNILPFWLRDLIELPAWPLAIGLFLHFHLLFPIENQTFLRRRNVSLALIYAPLILIVPHVYAVANDVSWAPRITQVGWGIWLSVYFVAGLLALHRSMKIAPNANIRKQTEITFHGTIVSLAIPFILHFLPNLLFGGSFPYSELSGLLVVLWPITLAYTIVKHRFMNIDFIVKRGVAYALISGFVVAAYFLLVVGIGRLVLLLTGASNQLVTIFATLLIATLFNPIKIRIQNFVERRFYPSRFTYKEAVQTFGHELVNVLDLDRLLKMLMAFFGNNMSIHPTAIYWRNLSNSAYVVREYSENLTSLPEFSSTDEVVNKLNHKKRLLDLSPLKDEPELITDSELQKWQQLKAEMIVPLLAKDTLCGFVTLGPKANDEPYFKEDLDLLQSLNDRINLSFENALLTDELREQDRMKRELEVARRIQLASLPPADPSVPGLDISAISIPAQEVGGDYYDYLELADGRFGVVVGDVSGKGTSAAFYMSQLKGILKTASKYEQSLKDLAIEVNSIIFKSIDPQHFITLSCGAFDMNKRKFSLVRAGHLPLIYYSARDQTLQQLAPKGIGVGLENGELFRAHIEESVIKYQAGDLFIFFSDGITEARNRLGEEFEIAPLEDVLRANGWHNAASLRQAIIARVSEFSQNTPQQDDMTLVVVRAI